MNLRVAFAGASGSGKTTLAKFVAEEYKLPLNPVGSRSTALAMGFASPYDVDQADLQSYQEALAWGHTPEAAAAQAILRHKGKETCRSLFQMRLQQAKIAWEIEHQDEGFVTDRSTFDDFAYMAMHNPYALNEAYLKAAQTHYKQGYDIVFFTPISAFQHIGDDPFRIKEPAYHWTYERLLFALCSDTGLSKPYFTQIFAKELEGRKAAVKNFIDVWRNR